MEINTSSCCRQLSNSTWTVSVNFQGWHHRLCNAPSKVCCDSFDRFNMRISLRQRLRYSAVRVRKSCQAERRNRESTGEWAEQKTPLVKNIIVAYSKNWSSIITISSFLLLLALLNIIERCPNAFIYIQVWVRNNPFSFGPTTVMFPLLHNDDFVWPRTWEVVLTQSLHTH